MSIPSLPLHPPTRLGTNLEVVHEQFNIYLGVRLPGRGSAHVRKASHTPSPAQESRPVHPTDGIRRLQHHGTSLSISTVSLVYPVSPTLQRLQSLMTQSAPTAAPGLQQSSPAYLLPEPLRGVVSAGRIRRVPQRESA